MQSSGSRVIAHYRCWGWIPIFVGFWGLGGRWLGPFVGGNMLQQTSTACRDMGFRFDL